MYKLLALVALEAILATATDATCFEVGVARPGDDIVPIISNSAEECRAACDADQRCKYWTYRISSKICRLKASYRLKETTTDAVSGSKVDRETYSDTALPSNEDLALIRSSPEECQTVCAADDRCKYFVWRKASQKCLLKAGKNTDNRQKNIDAVSGPKICPRGVPGEWGEWSECSVTCGEGTRTRERDCVKDFEWQSCNEDLEEEEACNDEPCSNCNPYCYLTGSDPDTPCNEEKGVCNCLEGYTGSTCSEASKMMILNGYPFENGQNVEIIDLNNASFNCSKFPKTDNMIDGIAGLVENIPIWCGGKNLNWSRIDSCQKLDLEDKIWKHAANLTEAKFQFGKGSIIVNGKLFVSGGWNKDGRAVDTIEMVSLDSSIVSNFPLPFHLFRHCNIQLNETNYMSTGGSVPGYRKTFYQNLETGTFTNGPDMNDGRIIHACTKFQLNGVNYAIVLGGLGVNSVEYLNLDQKDAKWKKLKITTDVSRGPYMLTHLNNVYLFGGQMSGQWTYSNKILKLDCKDTIETCKFDHHGNFQYGRIGHSVIPIPDDIVAKFC